MTGPGPRNAGAAPRDHGAPSGEPLVLPERFNGPPGSAHGGYACGRFAAAGGLDQRAGVAVTLLRPPPLGVALSVRADGARRSVWHGTDLVAGIAAARPAEVPAGPTTEVLPGEVPAAEGVSPAEDAGRHPFADCFVCGPRRAEGDGLRLFPRAVPGRPGTVAVAWTPAAEFCDDAGLVRAEFLWAVLDCPGGWTVLGPDSGVFVLNRFTAAIGSRPPAGSRLVITGRLERLAGRTAAVTTAVHHDGAPVARARARWTAVDPARFLTTAARGLPAPGATDAAPAPTPARAGGLPAPGTPHPTPTRGLPAPGTTDAAPARGPSGRGGPASPAPSEPAPRSWLPDT